MANHAPPKTEDASYQTRGNPNKMNNMPLNMERRTDMRFYRGAIERKEDPRKYYKFLTDHDRLIGEEVLRRGILESRLSTTWLNDLMKEWKKYIQNFAQD
ncbi:hypothetical protein GLOIN_2v921480 [Rhizophagus irregularis DAOM 181602=DAOM 197198]|nr:hypothetical protein GLOIN_2v921480 [Rhizophagus irregularis DAOM 181602=DAOM 197198]